MSASIEEEGVSECTRTQLLKGLTDLAFTLVDSCLLLYRFPIEEPRRKLEEDASLAGAVFA